MDEYGQRLRDTVGPYNEGAHLTLVCEAEGGEFDVRRLYSVTLTVTTHTGNPPPALSWLKDGQLVDDTWSMTPQGIIRNELVITRLRRSDLMTQITCQATNSNLTKPASVSITLDLNRKCVCTYKLRSLTAGSAVARAKANGMRSNREWNKGGKQSS